ncbi:hypothetical protein Y032_0397g697 [Ancylostoma ceylanicum]|uniref:Uncharacterized protein n=1 Tax=Ancylostoma ceylanicum TaxID=53326 RepID=A0A016RSE4_9BILA|nr:hypothetical protein Y032_0397g697 [Ancylostoma ceylanicum]
MTVVQVAAYLTIETAIAHQTRKHTLISVDSNLNAVLCLGAARASVQSESLLYTNHWMAGVAVHEDATKDPKIDQLPAEEKKSRRSLRGRRSSIKLVPEGASPGMVVAPLSESVVGDADMSPSAQLSKKRDRILTYMSHLQAEKEDWENRLQRREQLWERAKCIAERGLERKRIERVPVDELGRVDTGQKPRYVLNRIVRAFNKQNEDLHKQKVMNDILARRAVLKESLTKVVHKAHFVSRQIMEIERYQWGVGHDETKMGGGMCLRLVQSNPQELLVLICARFHHTCPNLNESGNELAPKGGKAPPHFASSWPTLPISNRKRAKTSSL